MATDTGICDCTHINSSNKTEKQTQLPLANEYLDHLMIGQTLRSEPSIFQPAGCYQWRKHSAFELTTTMQLKRSPKFYQPCPSDFNPDYFVQWMDRQKKNSTHIKCNSNPSERTTA